MVPALAADVALVFWTDDALALLPLALDVGPPYFDAADFDEDDDDLVFIVVAADAAASAADDDLDLADDDSSGAVVVVLATVVVVFDFTVVAAVTDDGFTDDFLQSTFFALGWPTFCIFFDAKC